MSPWVILIGAVYIGLEWLFASWVAGLIGWTWVIALELGLLALGLVVMRRAGMAAFRSLRPTTVDGVTVVSPASQEAMQQVGRDMGDAGSLFVAGALIALPGLVTSLIGLVLLVPPLRRAASRSTAAAVRRRAQRAGVVFGATSTVNGVTVVRGDVVGDDSARPIAGEILSGEIVRDEDPS